MVNFTKRNSVTLVSLQTHYKREYGYNLIRFAKGELTIDGFDKLATMFYPYFGIIIKHRLSLDLINKWLGLHGNNGKKEFIKANDIAMTYAKFQLFNAYIMKLIDEKMYARFSYKLFGEIVEPPKECIETTMEDEEFKKKENALKKLRNDARLTLEGEVVK